MSEEKETLRTEARRHRSWLDPASEDTESTAHFFFESIKPEAGQVVAAYWPKGREFDPGAILERLLAEGFSCALPVVLEESKELRFVRWDESIQLVEGAYGVMHPELNDRSEDLDPDILIVPLLAFDRRGFRLGQGGGYYDATLKALRDKKDITAVGLAYAQQAVLFNLPVEDHDQPLDWVITPQGTHYFGED